jgi:hypothetical protein
MAWNDRVLKLLGDVSGRVDATRNSSIFTASRLVTGVAAGANADSVLITGAKPVILFARNVDRSGSSVSAQIFEAPTYTGGTTSPIYNTNRANPVATTVSALIGVTTTVTGTQVTATSYAIGNASNQGQGGQAVLGELVYLLPNTTYLLRLTNLDTASATLSSFVAWAEGKL